MEGGGSPGPPPPPGGGIRTERGGGSPTTPESLLARRGTISTFVASGPAKRGRADVRIPLGEMREGRTFDGGGVRFGVVLFVFRGDSMPFYRGWVGLRVFKPLLGILFYFLVGRASCSIEIWLGSIAIPARIPLDLIGDVRTKAGVVLCKTQVNLTHDGNKIIMGVGEARPRPMSHRNNLTGIPTPPLKSESLERECTEHFLISGEPEAKFELIWSLIMHATGAPQTQDSH